MRRWAVGVALASLWSNTSPVESSDPECAAPGVVNEMEVKSSSDATAFQALLSSCAGGIFDVTWQGRVATDESFNVVNGTNLNITGATDSSSSTQPSSADDLTSRGVIEGDLGRYFDVHDNSTLTLDKMILECTYEGSSRPYGAIHTYTDETAGPVSPATVNVIDCVFRDSVEDRYGELAAVSILTNKRL